MIINLEQTNNRINEVGVYMVMINQCLNSIEKVALKLKDEEFKLSAYVIDKDGNQTGQETTIKLSWLTKNGKFNMGTLNGVLTVLENVMDEGSYQVFSTDTQDLVNLLINKPMVIEVSLYNAPDGDEIYFAQPLLYRRDSQFYFDCLDKGIKFDPEKKKEMLNNLKEKITDIYKEFNLLNPKSINGKKVFKDAAPIEVKEPITDELPWDEEID